MITNDYANRLIEFYNKMDVSIIAVDAQKGVLLYANQRVYSDMKLSKEDVLGQPYQKVFWKEFHPVYERLAQACEDEETHTDIFNWTSRKIWEQISARQVDWEPGQPAIFLTITNITDVSRSLYEFKQMAYHDPLLHLPNRLSLKQDINAIQSFDGVGIIRFDVQHLSSINDLYGWEAGDIILQQIRDWLFETNSTASKLYRIFEVGFCLLVQETNLEELENRATQIRNRFYQPWSLTVKGCEGLGYLTTSMGIIWGEDIVCEAQSLLFHMLGEQLPDTTSHIKCDIEYFEKLNSGMKMRQELIRCVRRGMEGFSVYYQPIVEITTGRWAGVEALCRWSTPNLGAISPTVFIKEAEQMGLVETIDDWVIKTAITDCWNIGLHEKNFQLDINLSPSRNLDAEFIQTLISYTSAIGYPREKLSIEITESTRIDFNEETLSNLNKLNKSKILLALDDFGTGYSSFENLLRISASVLKTDRMMIQDINTDTNKQFLMKMLVQLARYANMYFIVEGVETAEQKKLLHELGIKHIQGYFYSKPFPVKVLRENKHRFD